MYLYQNIFHSGLVISFAKIDGLKSTIQIWRGFASIRRKNRQTLKALPRPDLLKKRKTND